jgi:hypothetical protein
VSGWRKRQIKENEMTDKEKPFCYVYKENGEQFFAPKDGYYPADATPLYTHPPQRTEQEPVATVTSETGADITMSWWHEPSLPIGTKLYTTPPQRPWVDLTYEEICASGKGNRTRDDFAQTVLAKFKERNQ